MAKTGQYLPKEKSGSVAALKIAIAPPRPSSVPQNRAHSMPSRRSMRSIRDSRLSIPAP
jgi:hypothetical protein